jgi:hypothetical protein
MKVPIQSPSQLLNIGLPSLQAEISMYVPSSSLVSSAQYSRHWLVSDWALQTYRFENWRCTTGRVWPEHNRGWTRGLFPCTPDEDPFPLPLLFEYPLPLPLGDALDSRGRGERDRGG